MLGFPPCGSAVDQAPPPRTQTEQEARGAVRCSRPFGVSLHFSTWIVQPAGTEKDAPGHNKVAMHNCSRLFEQQQLRNCPFWGQLLTLEM